MSGNDSSFYVTGGTLSPNAPSYVERQADRDLLEGLRAGKFCYVLTPRQMGKSSLMIRTATRLRAEKTHVVVLDLTAIGRNLTPEQWYDGLLVSIGRQLELEEELEDYWQEHLRLSPVQRLFATIRDVALARRPGPHVIFIDEIDIVRSLPFSADEFFAAIRECYNRRTEDPELRRLSFCLLGVATPSDLVSDTRITPFNIGRRIELRDFLPDEAKPLTRGLVSHVPDALRPQEVLARMLYWTHGHPFLTQRMCLVASEINAQADRAIRSPADVDSICRELFFGERARERDDNLMFVSGRLLRAEVDRAGLLHMYDDVLRGQRVQDDERDPLVSVLRLAGIVRLEDGALVSRNRIYQRVFDRAWVRAQMPGAELERQRAAFYRGVIRATAIAAVVVVAMAGLVVYARWQARRAESALDRLTHAQSQSRRLMGMAGQRFDGVEAIRLLANIEPSSRLRNEAIACLALPDVRPRSTQSMNGIRVLALAHRLERYAGVDAAGRMLVRRWPENSEEQALAGSAERITQVRFSPGGRYVGGLQAQDDQSVLSVWELPSAENRMRISNAVEGSVIDFSHDDTLLAVGASDSSVRLYYLTNGHEAPRLAGPALPVAIRFRPGSHHYAVAWSNVIRVEIRAPVDGAALRELRVPSGIEGMEWAPDGRQLAVACADRRIYLWDVDNNQRLTLDAHQSVPKHLAFSPSGRTLASTGNDQTLRLWDCSLGGKPIATLLSPPAVEQLVFGPDEGQLVAVLADGGIQTWEFAPTAECQMLADSTPFGIAEFDVSPDGRWLVCARREEVRFWHVATGRAWGSLALRHTRDVVFSPSGELFTSDLSGVNSFPSTNFTAASGIVVQFGPGRSLGLPKQSRLLSCSADGKLLAVAWDEQVKVIQTADGTVRATLSTGPGTGPMALDPKGRWLAVASETHGELGVWDCASSKRIQSLPVSRRARAAFAPSGEWLAAGAEREWRLWQTGTWKEVRKVQRDISASQPAALAFSPDSRTLAVAGSDILVDLVEIQTGETLATFEPPRREPIAALRFSPDGTRLFCGAENGIVWAWDLWLLRRGLAKLNLDWPAPALAARAEEASIAAIRLTEIDKSIDPDKLRDLAMRYAQQEDYVRAEQQWRLFVEIIKDDPWAWRDLAKIHIFGPAEVRNLALAQTEAYMAIKLEPQNSDNQYRLGAALALGGNAADALQYLEQAEENKRTSASVRARAMMLRAICLARLDQDEVAAVLRRRAEAQWSDSQQSASRNSKHEWQVIEQETKAVFRN